MSESVGFEPKHAIEKKKKYMALGSVGYGFRYTGWISLLLCRFVKEITIIVSPEDLLTNLFLADILGFYERSFSKYSRRVHESTSKERIASLRVLFFLLEGWINKKCDSIENTRVYI